MRESPAKTLMKTMYPDQTVKSVAQLWSRRWTSDPKIVDPSVANAFSVLVAIPKDEAETWLKMSGMSAPPIFASVKMQRDQSNGPASSYRVIWLGKSMPEVASHLSQVEDHMGLVFKPPTSYGIRVHHDAFEPAWGKLRTGDKIPAQAKVLKKYATSSLAGTKLSWRSLSSVRGSRKISGSLCNRVE